MRNKEYSAGMVKHSFWFSEFRKVVLLLNQGKTLPEIKAMNGAENLFGAPTQRRAAEMFNSVSARVSALDPSFYPLFERSDIATQKLIACIAILYTDRLFFDFVYEVYREKLILGSGELEDSDYRIFFKNKQLQSEKVAAWTDDTLKRLGTCYKTLLMEAGLTDRASGGRIILRPILDRELEQCLRHNGMELIVRALTGVR